MSPHGKWLASYGIDGYVQVRATGSLVSNPFKFIMHELFKIK